MQVSVLTKLYMDLRGRLISAITTAYNTQHYLFENYNEKTGRGQGAAPFTGWTATYILAMGEAY